MAFQKWFLEQTAKVTEGTRFIRVNGVIDKRLPDSVEDSVWRKEPKFKVETESKYPNSTEGCRLTYRGRELGTWHFELFFVNDGHIQTELACELNKEGKPFCQGSLNDSCRGGISVIGERDIVDFIEEIFTEQMTEPDGNPFQFDICKRKKKRPKKAGKAEKAASVKRNRAEKEGG